MSGVGYDGADARWKGVLENGVLVGRYAVLVVDEASKMNINMAGNIASGGSHGYNEGWTTFEISIENFFNELGLSSPGTKAEDLIKYRYGENEHPGINLTDDDERTEGILEYDDIDNDGDGGAPDEGGEGDDEPDEFTPWYPRNDDNPFSTISQIKRVTGIGSTTWDNVKNLITVHSRTRNQYWDSGWKDKVNINAAAGVSELSTLLNGAGVSSEHQKAYNIIDYRDENIILSSIYTTTWIYGVEPILINEVLGRSYAIETTVRTKDDGGDHAYPYCTMTTPNTDLAPNTCYKIRITSGGADDFDVDVNGGGFETVPAGSFRDYSAISKCRTNGSGQITITLRDLVATPPATPSIISQVEFTCCEFVELCNISDKDISLENWKITVGSNEKNIPQGEVHPTFDDADGDPAADGQTYFIKGLSDPIQNGEGYFVITNDRTLFEYSYGNRTGTWGDDSSENIPVAEITSPDWVSGYATGGEFEEAGENITFKNGDDLFAERAVNTDGNSDNYGSSNRIGESREKDDPTMRSDWNNSTNAILKSSGLYRNDRAKDSGHDLDELKIKNHPFASIGEMSDISKYKGVASGSPWTAISGNSSTSDLGLIAGRITVDAVRLDAETYDDMSAATGWTNTGAAEPYLTKSYKRGIGSSNVAWWEWEEARLQPIPHMLYIYGLYINDDDYLDVRIWDYSVSPQAWDTITFSNLEYQPSDGLKIGSITTDNIGSDGRFKIELDTNNADVYFDYLLLVPQSVPGKINLNTALVDVLAGLPGIDAVTTAQDIYNNAHDGTPYQKLGDVLGTASIGAAEFAPISNLISVHSDVFKIICLAQTFDPLGEVVAEKKIEVIVDRSALPSGPIRILSWKEITGW